ncbi:hypothetical protein HUU39_10155 [candidate division KSB1 bacterium]|nr:hypothetical protein [bacterium]NUM65620.1 hypothetical protein [candidate division KSB1 bacterium]
MTLPFWVNLLKSLHLLCIIAGAGGALGQYLLVRRFARPTPPTPKRARRWR